MAQKSCRDGRHINIESITASESEVKGIYRYTIVVTVLQEQVEKIVKQTEYITTRGKDIVKYVDREVVKYDTKFASGGQCEIPKEFIKALNDAAEVPK